MTLPLNPILVKRYRRLAQTAGALVFSGGILVLLNWHNALLHPPEASFAYMKANSALAFVFAGAALWLVAARPFPRAAALAVPLAGSVIFLAAAVLVEHLANLDLGLDQALLPDPYPWSPHPGRVTLASAVAFFLAALSLLGLDRRQAFSQAAALGETAIGLMVVTAYAYDVHSLYGYAPQVAMSLGTAAFHLALGLGLLMARPDRGIMAIVAGDTAGGLLLRRLVPATVAVALLLGWLDIQGASLGWYDAALGAAWYTMATILAFVGLLVGTATALHRGELARRSAAAALRQTSDHLEMALASAQLHTFDYHHGSGDLQLDADAHRRRGLAPGQTISRGAALDWVHPEDRARILAAVDQSAAPLGNGEFEAEYRILWPDGSIHWTAARGRTQFEGEGPGRRPVRLTGVYQDITARREAARALEESRARLAAILDNLNEGVIVADPLGNILEMNPVALALHGYASPEEARRRLPEFTDTFELRTLEGQVLPIQEWPLGRVLAGERVNALELEVRRKADGSSRVLSYSGKLVADPGGTTMLALLAVRDISRRKRAEQALRESEARLRTIIENLAEGLIVVDPKGNTLHWNRKALAMHGYAGMSDMLASLPEVGRLYHMTTPEGRPLEFGEWPVPRLMRGEELSDDEVLVRHRALGWQRVFSYGGTLIRDRDGEPVMGLLTIRDITERRRAEAELRDSEERFRLLADNIAQLAWMADGEGSIFWFNQRWFDYTGTTPEEMRGWGWKTVPHPDHLERVVTKLNLCFATGTVWEDTFPLRSREGHYRWFLSRAIPVRDGDGRVIRWFGTNTDVTELREVEERLRESERRLEERVRERTTELEAANRELESFSYSVSHDLRAPLRAIGGFARILQEDFAPQLSAEVQRYLGLVQANTLRMGRLIEDLLAFSRLGRKPLNRQRIKLDDLVRQCLEDLKGDWEGRPVEFHFAPLGDCEGDPGLLRQVLMNLLSNAIKYSRRRDPARIEAGTMARDGERVLFVRDNGVGFDMAHAGKLFGVFQRLHRADEYEGTGVGLAIVERIVHRHGWRIWAESEPDRGSTFFIGFGPGSPGQNAPGL